MKRYFLICLCALCACAWSLPAFGWGQEGHRIVAKIAYDNLNCSAKRHVDKILGKQGMIYWSTWADELKSDNIYKQSLSEGWHYQDFPAGLSDSVVADALTHYREEGGSLFRALDSLELEMTAEKVSAVNAIHNLRFIVHLHSDRYCPMHMAHLDDKGGNAIRMKWFGRDSNLHNVWDTKLIESQGYSYTEYAEMIEYKFKDIKREVEKATDEQLLIDTYQMTQSIYSYQEIWDGNTYHYIYTWHELMEKQLFIAGIRLAQVLNKLF